jgi:filamentous hemagglutinin family protein
MPLRGKGLGCCALLLTLSAALTHAQIKTDGSLGAKQTLTGPNFAIPAALGRQAGGNLFHSFSDFNIQGGESATFSGPGSVHNVLARVTGGSVSTINGALRCDIPGANLYLMNPNGVVFGPGATLDLSGSFAVTSADSIRLGKSGRFNAAPAANEVLTSAAPTAFGFLAARPGPSVALVGSQLSVNTGKTLSIISNGNIAIATANLSAPAGRVNLVAAASKGQVGVRPDDLDSPIDSSLSKYADVAAAGNTVVDVSGDSGGRVSVRANDLSFDASGIASVSSGSASPARSLDIDVAGRLTLTNGAALNVSTLGQTRGGNVDIHAHKFDMSGGSKMVALTAGAEDAGDFTITARSITIDGTGTAIANGPAAQALGNGGNVSLIASNIAVTDGAQVLVGTLGSGNGGVIRVQSDELVIKGNGVLRATGLLASSDPGTTGAGGDISVRTGTLRVARHGTLIVGTQGAGNGGTLDVRANDVLIRGTGTTKDTGLFGNAELGTSGQGGNVAIRAGSVRLNQGGVISVETAGSGRGGNIGITSNSLVIDGLGTIIQADTAAPTNGGLGGNIQLEVRELILSGGAYLEGATFGSGHGGNILINSESVVIRDPGSSIFAPTTATNGGGDAGTLTLNSDSLTIRDGGNIIVGTFGSGAGGRATINAPRVVMHGLSSDTIDDSSTLIAVGSVGGTGPGGNLELRANAIHLENSAQIAVGTTGAGRGGNAVFDAREITLNRAAIIAGSEAIDPTGPPATGDAGSITLHASKTLSLSNGSNIGAKAVASNGGTIDLQAPRITMRHSMISGQAGKTGGSINVAAHDLLYLYRSSINAVGQQQIGSINIDPIFTVLDQSSIMTTTDVAGGNINVRTDRFFKSADSFITAARNATVTLTIYTPEPNITGSLVPVNSPLIDASASFIEECSRRLQTELSSFLITGRGAIPVEAGGLNPSFDLGALPGTSPSTVPLTQPSPLPR